MLVYSDVSFSIDGETQDQLVARKVMYDKGYSVFVDISVPATEKGWDYLRTVSDQVAFKAE